MAIAELPPHIVVDILYYSLQQSSLASGLRLRLVSRRINQEVLYVFYTLRASDIRNRWPYGQIIPFDELAMVRYLHGLTIQREQRPVLQGNPDHWLRTIDQGAEVLQSLVPNWDDLILIHEDKHALEPRGPPGWVYRRIMCEAMVTFLGAEECYTSLVLDRRKSESGTPHQCILNRSIDFWIVMAACHVGSNTAVEKAISNLRQSIKPSVDWRAHLNGCMYVAARRGHTEVVQQLLEIGLDVNEQAYRGCLRFCGGDGTALCGATTYGSLELVELLLTHGLAKEGSAYHWAMYECMNNGDKFDERVKIMKRLLEEDRSEREDPELQRKLASWSSSQPKTSIVSSVVTTAKPVLAKAKALAAPLATAMYPAEFGKVHQWG